MKLIVKDFGDRSVGLREKSWEVDVPFEKVDSDIQDLTVFRKDIEALYRNYADGRVVAEYDFELEYAAQMEKDLNQHNTEKARFPSFGEYLQNTAKEMKKLTRSNNHTESVMRLARFVDDKQAYEVLKAIQEKINKVGHINNEQIASRMKIMYSLLNQVKAKHGESAYRLLHGSM